MVFLLPFFMAAAQNLSLGVFWIKRFSWCFFFQLLWTVEFVSKQSLSGGISVYAVSVISHKCLLSSVCFTSSLIFFSIRIVTLFSLLLISSVRAELVFMQKDTMSFINSFENDYSLGIHHRDSQLLVQAQA